MTAPQTSTGPRDGYRPGVGVMLVNRRGLVFVGRRVDLPGDSWQMPQGGIDAGETPRQAALRELREETGTDRARLIAESARWLHYDLPPELASTVWGGRYRGQSQKWLAYLFTGNDADIDLATAKPEFLDWKWAEMTALADLIVAFKRQLYLDVVDELGPAVRAALAKN